MTFRERYDAYRILIDKFLEENLSDDTCAGQEKMAEAMRYSALAGGKRIRPVLTLEFCRLCGGKPEDVLPFAAALEMIHTYSLIHDDLPCMDDDDLRRGKPTSHKMFGEAIAVLAGDALLTRAFEVASSPEYVSQLPVDRVLDAIHTLASKAGVMGMIGGQVLDMEGETNPPDLDGLIRLQNLKTGALIRAAAQLGCIIGGGTAEQKRAANDYASALGLAFQIRDDMLDEISTDEELGKPVGSDCEQGKTTFMTLFGMEGCQNRITELTQIAKDSCVHFEDASFLITLAESMAIRRN